MANRVSMYTTASAATDERTTEADQGLWQSMLASVASSKRVPEKNLIVLGGTAESQREMLATLSRDQRRGPDVAPPVANDFALGYTYYDVMEHNKNSDVTITLARISLHLLSTPSRAFSDLITPILTPATIPNTLIVILLDWKEPHLWLRQLLDWVLFLRSVMEKLDHDCWQAMERVMTSWKGRRGEDRSMGGGDGGTGSPTTDGDGADNDVALGPGEWEDALGLPLCVVCQNAQHMDELETKHSWREANFDTILMYLRTVLLRHGASLIYTTADESSDLSMLIHTSLDIESSRGKWEPPKASVIERDKILVPPNWDSAGKIRVLRDGSDMELEEVSQKWSEDIHQGLVADQSISPPPMSPTDEEFGGAARSDPQSKETDNSAVSMYEDKVPYAGSALLYSRGQARNGDQLEVPSMDIQDFLRSQLKVLDGHRQKADSNKPHIRIDTEAADGRGGSLRGQDLGVSHHIGPVKCNIGGIQVDIDADDAVRRLNEQQEHGRSPDATTPIGSEPMSPSVLDSATTAEMKPEQLQMFFANLLNKGGAPK